jgi:hypothetical protein
MLEWLECWIVGMVGKSECVEHRKVGMVGKLESQVVGIVGQLEWVASWNE